MIYSDCKSLDIFLFIFFFLLDFTHVEFTLGGDPALPIRVLISVKNTIHRPHELSDSSEEEEVSQAIEVDWRKRFIELIFGPALANLSCHSLSRMKGAGNFKAKKWHVHHSDWSKICFEVDRLSRANEVFGQYL